MFGVDGLRQHREHAEAHLLLTVLLVPHLKNRNRRKRPHEDGGSSSREGSAKPDSLPDVTSLRSSETSLAWAVSKVSGSRWNRLDQVPFFRAALYFSWNTHGSRAGYPGRMCVCVAVRRCVCSGLPHSAAQKPLWRAASPESRAEWNTASQTLLSFPVCTLSGSISLKSQNIQRET